jgi:multidrug efflux pump subunit AcrA (membrane-fusion protein)
MRSILAFFARFWGWIKRHPIWSVLIAIVLLLVGSAILSPTPITYAYVTEAAGEGEIRQIVSASGKVRAQKYRARLPMFMWILIHR